MVMRHAIEGDWKEDTPEKGSACPTNTKWSRWMLFTGFTTPKGYIDIQMTASRSEWQWPVSGRRVLFRVRLMGRDGRRWLSQCLRRSNRRRRSSWGMSSDKCAVFSLIGYARQTQFRRPFFVWRRHDGKSNLLRERALLSTVSPSPLTALGLPHEGSHWQALQPHLLDSPFIYRTCCRAQTSESQREKEEESANEQSLD